jgi:hypothetical protein
MSTPLADLLDAAIRDGGELVRWAEPNTIALEDERIDALVQRALRSSVPPECAVGVPLLRFANSAVPDVPLLDAIVDDRRHNSPVCDRCNTRVHKTDRLLVPAGASVVAIHCCSLCRGILQDVFACCLVWG